MEVTGSLAISGDQLIVVPCIGFACRSGLVGKLRSVSSFRKSNFLCDELAVQASAVSMSSCEEEIYRAL